MNVLAFDTCFGAVSAAVCRVDAVALHVLAEVYEARTTGHAERLVPIIEEALKRSGVGLSEIARFAVSVGPGGFTGVRVGVAAARALSLATGQPAVGVTSLAAMAHEAQQQLGDVVRGRLLAIAVDARGGMVYVQLFEDGGAAGAPALLTPADAATLVGRRQAMIVGSGAAPVANVVMEAGGQAEVCLTDLQPRARAVAALAVDVIPAGPVRPLYLRRPDTKLQADKSLPRVAS
jgi:tRNA threonylcarbamoyladenosine biosynthesis protein TsaB